MSDLVSTYYPNNHWNTALEYNAAQNAESGAFVNGTNAESVSVRVAQTSPKNRDSWAVCETGGFSGITKGYSPFRQAASSFSSSCSYAREMIQSHLLGPQFLLAQ
jgi:hypothetical protein